MKLRRHKEPETTAGASPMQLHAAYAVCRSISRSAARNFYYAFLALPREKRDAICAVYAFMRHADDLSDEPGLRMEERRARLIDWMDRLHRVIDGERTDDPVLMALADAMYRYSIPPALLESLIEGTEMDVDPEVPASHMAQPEAKQDREAQTATAVVPLTAQYATFPELYRYCYHVASVVGLICIRIFGYKDPAAEELAERCGVAFQLTNIIRDVKEDAAMGRVYLPKEDFDQFELSAAELGGDPLQLVARFRPLLEFEANRAREFYLSADKLLPYIDEDSRPALWVLVTIYRRLLEKIASRNYEIFGEKVRLSFWDKFSVLAQGIWQRIV